MKMVMGFEGESFYGVAGSTAATRMTESVDISYNFDAEFGNTTPRGNSAAPPIDTQKITVRKVSLSINMLHDADDAVLEAMRAAMFNGNPIAVRLKDDVGGKGFDGDCYLTCGHDMPLRAEQTFKFTGTPCRDAGRSPQLYV